MDQQEAARPTINERVRIIKAMLKWATAREMLPPAIYHAVNCIEGLRAGRSDTKESKVVKPVPEAHIAANVAALPWCRP